MSKYVPKRKDRARYINEGTTLVIDRENGPEFINITKENKARCRSIFLALNFHR